MLLLTALFCKGLSSKISDIVIKTIVSRSVHVPEFMLKPCSARYSHPLLRWKCGSLFLFLLLACPLVSLFPTSNGFLLPQFLHLHDVEQCCAFRKHGYFDLWLFESSQATGDLWQEHSIFVKLLTALLHCELPHNLHLQIREQVTFLVKQGHLEVVHEDVFISPFLFLPQLHPFSSSLFLVLACTSSSWASKCILYSR